MLKFFSLALLFFLLSANVCLAAGPNLNEYSQKIADQGGYGPATETSLAQMVGMGVKAALSLTGVIFLGLTVYAGFLWMTAHGNDEQAGKGKKILEMAVLGMIVILASYSITDFVVKNLTGTQ